MQSHSMTDMTCDGRESVEGKHQELKTVEKMSTGKYHICRAHGGNSLTKAQSNNNNKKLQMRIQNIKKLLKRHSKDQD